MINLTREEAQQVLECLSLVGVNNVLYMELDETEKVIKTLRARLSAPELEPVAYGVLDDDGQIDWTAEYPFSNEPGWPDSVPLYTTPPQRKEWQGLTDEEVVGRANKEVFPEAFARGVLWASEKLKENNT